MTQQPPPTQLDHLVYATPDLSATINALGKFLAVRPVIGGQHPNFGTQNALLSLGPTRYLEVIGPRSDADRPTIFGIDQLKRPRLATWVLRSDDIHRHAASAKQCGLDLGEVQTGKRQQPDGQTLSWRLSDLYVRPEHGLVPFLIDWGHSPHPAQYAPAGCSLISLSAQHPEPERLSSLLDCLNIQLPITQAPQPGLVAVLDTPNGQIELR